MKAVLVIAVAVFSLCGCKRHQPAVLKEAVNGAFGWALGARLPAAFDIQTNAGSLSYIDPRGNVPPFDRVVLDLTTNRTIFAITATLTAASPQTFKALEKSLNETLAQKHIFKKKTVDGGVTRVFYGDQTREAILAISPQPPTLALCYRDTTFLRQAQQEMIAWNLAPRPAAAAK